MANVLHTCAGSCLVRHVHHILAFCYEAQHMSVQATQVRKTNYVPEKGVNYTPDKNHTCTVYAGTMVQQVTGKHMQACKHSMCSWL